MIKEIIPREDKAKLNKPVVCAEDIIELIVEATQLAKDNAKIEDVSIDSRTALPAGIQFFVEVVLGELTKMAFEDFKVKRARISINIIDGSFQITCSLTSPSETRSFSQII